MTDTIRTEQRGATAIVVMNRPSRRNALDRAALGQLTMRIQELSADRAIRTVVLTGAQSHFCAGADIDELRQLGDQDAARAHAQVGQAACNALEQAPVPIIAAIDGYCVGGGLELAISCDLRVGGPQARFGQVELGIGSIAAWGGMRRLPRLIGVAAAKRLVYTGGHVDAPAALRLGLIHDVVEDPLAAALDLADDLAGAPPQAMAASKRALDHCFDVPLQAGLEQDRETFANLSVGEEFREGVEQFLRRSSRA